MCCDILEGSEGSEGVGDCVGFDFMAFFHSFERGDVGSAMRVDLIDRNRHSWWKILVDFYLGFRFQTCVQFC